MVRKWDLSGDQIHIQEALESNGTLANLIPLAISGIACFKKSAVI